MTLGNSRTLDQALKIYNLDYLHGLSNGLYIAGCDLFDLRILESSEETPSSVQTITLCLAVIETSRRLCDEAIKSLVLQREAQSKEKMREYNAKYRAKKKGSL
ncbi:MAG TPA: hypothetical protein VHZ76_00905 [Gammaproteobacteria bacterium]|jgi:hypothetical protein|nr:hypothetical protein [Gammaproteobacteria bacterium]